MPEKDVSMFKTVEEHSRVIDQHDELLEDHTVQLKVQAEQIKQLQDNAIKLENVVMSENRETRLTITQTNHQLHELISNLMGYNTGKNQMTNNLKMARWESIAKIVGILAGSGGLLYWLFGAQ